MSDAVKSDDVILPFAVEALDVRGRAVRLSQSFDTIVRLHKYPPQVCRAIGEGLALTALLGSALKLDGRFQLQTKTDGAISQIVVDYDAPDRLRAYARYDSARLSNMANATTAELLGKGHLGLTIDQGGDMSRYQGIVVLNGEGFETAAHHYFDQSEQIPTLIRLAVAENISPHAATWRAGGLMVQFLPHSEDRKRQRDLAPGDHPAGVAANDEIEDDAWAEARALVNTVEDHELVDPLLTNEHLLYRLFHERGATVFEPQNVRQACRCSRPSILTMLSGFSAQEQNDMVETSGKIGITCEFCSTHYEIALSEIPASESA